MYCGIPTEAPVRATLGSKGENKMAKRRPEDYILCETTEQRERLICDNDLALTKLEIANRIIEIFGCQSLSTIVFRLKCNAQALTGVLNGETFPSTELLLGIQHVTGSSIDWILTGYGPKFISAPVTATSRRVVHAADRFRPEKTPDQKRVG